MALFTCKVGTPDGTILVREHEASDAVKLRLQLEEQGFHIFDIKKKPFQFLFDKGLKRRRIENRELLTFNQELLVLFKAGMPILQILDTMLERRGEKGSKLAGVLSHVREDVKGGAALSVAMERHGAAFPHLYLASIRAGERTGDLPKTIRRYIQFLKRADAVKKKIVASLVYPTILIFMAAAVVSVLLVFVVPTISQIYADSGSQLPLASRIVIGFSRFLRTTIIFWIFAVVGGLAWFRTWSATDSGRYKVDHWKLHLPMAGAIFSRYSIAVFARTLATLLGSGIPIVESLRMAVGTLNNRFMERKMHDAVRHVEEGGQLSVALERMHIFPPLVLRMLGVGETTGALEEMLNDSAEYLEDEVEERLQILTSSIEPLVMVVMGVVIGAIIVAMYLPIFKIAGTVG